MNDSKYTKGSPDHILFNKAVDIFAPQILKLNLQNAASINLKRHLHLSQKPVYKCNRKFCNVCLRTCYEDDFKMCKNSRSWICHFCMGVCFCTRCLRQDVVTQLKAFLISMGGSLSSISALKRKGQLDAAIEENFQTHLFLTLLTNIHLFNKYDSYRALIEQRDNKSEPQSAVLSQMSSSKQSLQKIVSDSNLILTRLFDQDQLSKILEYGIFAASSEDLALRTTKNQDLKVIAAIR